MLSIWGVDDRRRILSAMRYPHPLHIKGNFLYGKRYSVGYMACQFYAALSLTVIAYTPMLFGMGVLFSPGAQQGPACRCPNLRRLFL